MRNWLFSASLIILLLSAIALLGCPFGTPTVPGPLAGLLGEFPMPIVPEAAARTEVPTLCNDGTDVVGNVGPRRTASFRIGGTRPGPRGSSFVVYSADCVLPDRPDATSHIVGYSLVEPDGWRWRATGGGARYEKAGVPLAGDLINYDSRGNDGEGYAIVFGEVLSERAAVVEVVFDTGEIRRDDAKGGVFALHTPHAVAACELRVRGSAGGLLARLDLAGPYLPQGPHGSNALPPNACP